MSDTSIALVTGAAQGIGYACAEAIQESGAKMVLADINGDGAKSAADQLGGGALAITCDMADPAQITAMFDRIERRIVPWMYAAVETS